MACKRSDADPCMYFKWTEAAGLLIWLSWIDDCVCFGQEVAVEESKLEMKNLFECEDGGCPLGGLCSGLACFRKM